MSTTTKYTIGLPADEIERRLKKVADLAVIYEANKHKEYETCLFVTVDRVIEDGSELKFKAGLNYSDITHLCVAYSDIDTGSLIRKYFNFTDANGNDLADLENLFAADAVIKVILADIPETQEYTDCGKAFIQNADTNAYLENRFDEIDDKFDVANEAIYTLNNSLSSNFNELNTAFDTQNQATTTSITSINTDIAGINTNINAITGRLALVEHSATTLPGQVAEAVRIANSVNAKFEAHTHTLEAIGAAAEDHTHTPADIGAAEEAHTHTLEDFNGVLPTTKGGTGIVATNIQSLVAELGANGVALVGHTHDGSSSSGTPAALTYAVAKGDPSAAVLRIPSGTEYCAIPLTLQNSSTGGFSIYTFNGITGLTMPKAGTVLVLGSIAYSYSNSSTSRTFNTSLYQLPAGNLSIHNEAFDTIYEKSSSVATISGPLSRDIITHTVGFSPIVLNVEKSDNLYLVAKNLYSNSEVYCRPCDKATFLMVIYL